MRFIRIPHDIVVWSLLIVSLILYALQYLFFGHAQDIGFSFMGNLAFLPVYVLFVTLMIERVLKEREREAMIKKLNMVIGVFFSEVGNGLLHAFVGFICDGGEFTKQLALASDWSAADFARARLYLEREDICIDCRRGDLNALKGFIAEKRLVMLTLMENPNLLEHEEFTDLLWAVFHMMEELQARRLLEGLPESDLDHLSGDLQRAHSLLLIEWVRYMEHLRSDYPYLFSLAVRTNPMNPQAHAEVY